MVLTVKDDNQIRVNMGEPIWEPAKFHLPQINLRKIIFCVQIFKPYYVVQFQWGILIVLYK